MHLEPGRVEQMVADATKDEGCIPCHKNIDRPGQAVCRGFFELGTVKTLRLAEAMGIIEEVTLKGEQ